MADPYKNFVKLATKMINKYGRSAVLRAEIASGDDWNPTITQTEVPVKVFSSSYSLSEIDGTLIESSDIKFLVDSTVDVETSSKIVDDDGKVYDVISVPIVRPGPTKVMSKVQARLSG